MSDTCKDCGAPMIRLDETGAYKGYHSYGECKDRQITRLRAELAAANERAEAYKKACEAWKYADSLTGSPIDTRQWEPIERAAEEARRLTAVAEQGEAK